LGLMPTPEADIFARSCMLSVRPCGWTIPDKWQKEERAI
jgi:hypothetical protein